jgi:hypothetical protein
MSSMSSALAAVGIRDVKKEDSAHAIFLLIVASNSATQRVRQGFESHFLPWAKARTFSEDRPNSADPLHQRMQREVMNPFVAEFFGAAIMRRLRIRTAEQTICSAKEARMLSADFVIKAASGEESSRNLSWSPASVRNGFCLISRLVPEAASLDFVARKIVTSHSARAQFLRTCARMYNSQCELTARAFGKQCEPADKFYADFNPSSSEIERIKAAMSLDGIQYLKIAAARVFLGCSCPHFSNMLTTKDGQLISIDHCRSNFENGEDLRELFYFINRDSVAFAALSTVARLTEEDIRASVEEIPRHRACGSTNGLAEYFVERLRLWKTYHAQELGSSYSMTVDPSLMYSSLNTVAGHSVANEAIAMARTWK